jgi:hypothetical protein
MRLSAFSMSCGLVLLACGSDENGRGGTANGVGSLTLGGVSETGDATQGEGEGEGENGEAGNESASESGGVKFDMPPQPDLMLGCDGGGGGDGPAVDFSYIWIANSNESTVSKIDTEALVEEGRYVTRPDQNGNPSRTSVNLNGDAVVANRAGGVTMIFARPDDCPDPNNTSSGAGDVKVWPDGCVGWHTPMDYATQRPVAWTAGTFDESTCRYEDTKVWTSGGNGSIDVLLLDGETGVIEETIPIPGVAVEEYGLYGGAVDSGDNFWALSRHDEKLVRVDRLTLAVQVWDTPVQGYGMAVDRNDRVWTCDGQVGRFDYPTQTWQTANAGGNGGCMPDGDSLIWLANDPMVGVDIDTMMVVQMLDVPSYVHGVSIDFNGYVWGPAIDDDVAYRVDPATGVVDTITGFNYPYTYSDMTGFGLSQVGGPIG